MCVFGPPTAVFGDRNVSILPTCSRIAISYKQGSRGGETAVRSVRSK
jgi:hypothetical protein